MSRSTVDNYFAKISGTRKRRFVPLRVQTRVNITVDILLPSRVPDSTLRPYLENEAVAIECGAKKGQHTKSNVIMETSMAPSKSLQLAEKACGLCQMPGRTMRCSRCQVIYYCSREHQAQHRTAHKSACSKIGKTRTTLAAEEQKLRDMPADILFPGDVFNSSVGHFWGIIETRPYMRARSAYIHALMEVDSRESVQLQLEHAWDMLRLCRGDNIGIRDAIPGAMLQLGMDQECYDFLKWYETTGQLPDYDWGDVEQPFLDVKDADAFEDVGYVCHRFLGVTVGAGVMLVKVRMLLDLKDLHMQSTSTNISANTTGPVQLRSSIIAKNTEFLQRSDHTAAIQLLEGQVKDIYKAIHSSNKHFWEVLLEPEDHLPAMPGYYSPGELSEMQAMLRYFYPAWAMTPGALELAEELTKGKL
ncbi:hypothetical protein GX51_03255 [Blastomyces parvus]|uniref:MYND-type domain-containing protein n=1 Tax=Blastomyces parvus TaxID=2060905 RepID=A0A2B7X7B4_9EURO|nr:hypothetical protein GX51_03255 [Blastomyces parvus]